MKNKQLPVKQNPKEEKPKMILDLYELANKLSETKKITKVRFDWN
jgi:hypothetical protein